MLVALLVALSVALLLALLVDKKMAVVDVETGEALDMDVEPGATTIAEGEGFPLALMRTAPDGWLP
jgi:hypothetical protein